jgi:GH15 family glucan-1,4-alpha-glucosidase
MEEARPLFARLVSVANDAGLLAEEYDPTARRQLGNFTQAFWHVAMIKTAMNPRHPRSRLRACPRSHMTHG